jgi:hypothetical protein
VQNIFKVEYRGINENGSLDVNKRAYELGIIASQDCDLDVINGSVNKIDGILIFKTDYFGGLSSSQKSRIFKNNDARYQFFEAVPQDCDAEAVGLPELIVDFKVFFTLTYEEMLKQLSLANGMKRRAFLLPPYREHFVNRAAHYIQRVAIDPQHSLP